MDCRGFEEQPPKPKPRRYEIGAPGVMWSEDGAGFHDRGRKRELLVAQDRRALPDRKRFRQEVEREERWLVADATSRHQRDAARRRAVEEVLSRYGLIEWKGDVSQHFQAVGGTN